MFLSIYDSDPIGQMGGYVGGMFLGLSEVGWGIDFDIDMFI